MCFAQTQGVLTTSSVEYQDKASTFSIHAVNSTSPLPRYAVFPPSPKEIILGLWPGARSAQIDYYTRGYESLYPSARLILLHHSHHSTKFIEDVLECLTEHSEHRSPGSRQDVLVHLFGDDAAVQVCRLLRAYRQRAGRPLGVKSMVLDTLPVLIAPNLRAVRNLMPNLLVFVYLVSLAICWRLVSVLTLWFSEPFQEQVQRDLHDPCLLPAEACKCYIFPEKDVMFAWDRPGHEDDVCERQDFQINRRCIDHTREKWTGDQERYWMGIENAWEGR